MRGVRRLDPVEGSVRFLLGIDVSAGHRVTLSLDGSFVQMLGHTASEEEQRLA